jgi:NADH:flavin oxidoreductase / NADH oxidase family
MKNSSENQSQEVPAGLVCREWLLLRSNPERHPWGLFPRHRDPPDAFGKRQMRMRFFHLRSYAQRASAGLIIAEATAISPDGFGWADTPGLWSADQVRGWRRVTDAVPAARFQCALRLRFPPVSASYT